jgi:hypothetical protein
VLDGRRTAALHRGPSSASLDSLSPVPLLPLASSHHAVEFAGCKRALSQSAVVDGARWAIAHRQ